MSHAETAELRSGASDDESRIEQKSVTTAYVVGGVRTLSLGGADFTGISPALTWHPGAAARFLRSVLRLWSQAAAIFKLGIAVVHTDI